jgi:DNA polymerase-3 subunit delta'
VTLKLGTVEDGKIRDYLMEKLGVPDYTADICTAFAGGYLGKAVELASNEDFNEMKQVILSLLKEIGQLELSDLVQRVKVLQAYKLRMDDFFDILTMWFRDVLLYKATDDRNGIVFKEEASAVVRQAGLSGYDGIQNILEALEKAKARLKANVNFELTLELLLLTIKENS